MSSRREDSDQPPALSESPLISDDSDSEDERPHAEPMDLQTFLTRAPRGQDVGLSDDDDMPSLHTVSDSSDDEPSESAWESESEEDSEEEEDNDGDFAMSEGEQDDLPVPPRPRSPSPREAPRTPQHSQPEDIEGLRSLTARDDTAPQVC